MGYTAPLKDILSSVRAVGGIVPSGGAADDPDMVQSILDAAGTFAAEVLFPLRRAGDTHGATYAAGAVTTPPGWKAAYQQFSADGWNAAGCPGEFGGMGFPMLLSIPLVEMWNSANPAFALCPMLTQGAVNLIHTAASDALKATYLPNMVSGVWTGTMCLTEPSAGSDLGSLKTKAVPRDDGTYRIFGSKIFITYGEHDLTENIIHLVLARVPDAPPGVKGISLFLVPKVLVGADGALGERNDVVCTGVEHKLGIHGSPTCSMAFGERGEGAVGYLVGEVNEGLKAMFLMMNEERLGIAVQGVGVAEAAYQHALSYARERVQRKRIIEFPDVRRMLLSMKAQTDAARMVCYTTARALDHARAISSKHERDIVARTAAFLTPVAKAYATDTAVSVASLGIQVSGGMGYMEESGAPQFLRDARIMPIYEGTNGIQALDVVTRRLGKTVQDSMVCAYIDYLRVGMTSKIPMELRLPLGVLLSEARTATESLLEHAPGSDMVLAGAVPYIRLLGITVGAAFLTRRAVTEADPAHVALAEFFLSQEASAAIWLCSQVVDPWSVLVDHPDLV